MKKNLSVFVKLFLVVAMFAFGVMGIIGCSSGGGGGTPVPTATHTVAPTASPTAARSGSPTPSASASPTATPTTFSSYTISGTITWEGYPTSEGLFIVGISSTEFTDGSMITSDAIQLSSNARSGTLEYSFPNIPFGTTVSVLAILTQNPNFRDDYWQGDLVGSFATGRMPKALKGTADLTHITAEGSTANISGNNFALLDHQIVHPDVIGYVTDSTGEGIFDAYLHMTGSTVETQTSGADGQYRFSNVPAGICTITPTMDGYTFNPTSETNTIFSSEDMIFGTFEATGIPLNVFGKISSWDASAIPGATVRLNGGGHSSTETTNGSGNYSFTAPYGTHYILSVSDAGVLFNPSTESFTLTQETTVNFAATTESISGSILLSGNPFLGAQIILSGESNAIATSDSSGSFIFTGLTNGTYTVSPTPVAGYTFSPTQETVTLYGNCAINQNFTAEAIPLYTISGEISGIPGARVNYYLTSSEGTISGETWYTTYYVTQSIPQGIYSLSVEVTDYIITPETQVITIDASNVTAEPFMATHKMVTISGKVTNTSGSGTLEGLTIKEEQLSAGTESLTGSSSSTTTDADGLYSLIVPTGYKYEITADPSHSWQVNARSYDSVENNINNVDFHLTVW